MYKTILIGLIVIFAIGCVKTDLKSSASTELSSHDLKYLAAEGKRPYMVMLGPSPIDNSLIETPYSDRARPVVGSIKLSAYDIVPLDFSQRQDNRMDELQSFMAEFVEPESGDLFSFIITDLVNKKDFQSFGGIGIDKMIHGDTLVGTDLLPKTFAHLVLFGQANILRNGVVVERGVPIELFVSQGIRNDVNQRLLLTRDTHDQEIHMIMPGNYEEGGTEIKSAPKGFFYLYFEDVDVYRHTTGSAFNSNKFLEGS